MNTKKRNDKKLKLELADLEPVREVKGGAQSSLAAWAQMQSTLDKLRSIQQPGPSDNPLVNK